MHIARCSSCHRHTGRESHSGKRPGYASCRHHFEYSATDRVAHEQQKKMELMSEDDVRNQEITDVDHPLVIALLAAACSVPGAWTYGKPTARITT